MIRRVTILEAVEILKKGGIIAYPTETFYGLGVDPHNSLAVERIFQVKGREATKPVSLILAGEEYLEEWVEEVSEKERRLMSAFWPGPLTLVLAAKNGVSPFLTGGSGRLGVRVSSNATARKLAEGIGGAITATSANRSGKDACLTPPEVEAQLGESLDGIVPGTLLRHSKGSTILACSDSKLKVIREGELSWQRIESILT